MKKLAFFDNGICVMKLKGLPEPGQIENLIEEYVMKVELLPQPLKLIVIDISQMIHMGVRSRQVFSELLIQASRHYGGKIELVIAGGSLNLQRYIQLFCKSIGFKDRSHVLADMEEANLWIDDWLKKQDPSFKHEVYSLREQTV
ncbi:hypothetical protein GF359_00775 [candidate division WOR-3 bacterium]|uniref:Uncharacterized protein n=1 Tax=candidate division WOR-3 bacterium TaxID=2052148 RepID=A0A9D5K7J8_UNCW3|nr:hypothetical protein [candidate division WOR-3 bacterium]MBD3363727.1 hypothetical protein [candidate division WOR-3 bacterium]